MRSAAQLEYQQVLDFWFGSVEETVIPSEHRARVWFGDNPQFDEKIRAEFSAVHEKAVSGALTDWEGEAHGKLALVLLLDQFSRHLSRGTADAFLYDAEALKICVQGIEAQLDHELSLIERVFFYFPLLHAEALEFQALSVQCYEVLVELALPETRVVYDSFLRFSNHHCNLIRRFGRFPQRNQCLGRKSISEELGYLKEQEGA